MSTLFTGDIKNGDTVRIVKADASFKDWVGLEGVFEHTPHGGFNMTPTHVPTSAQRDFEVGKIEKMSKMYYTFEIVQKHSPARSRIEQLRAELEEAEEELRREESTDVSKFPVGTYVTYLIGLTKGDTKRVAAFKTSENYWAVMFGSKDNVSPGGHVHAHTNESLTRLLRKDPDQREVRVYNP